MAKRRRYTDDFRASAVVMLESQGYPDVIGALSRVAKHLDVPTRTLRRWFKGELNPPPDKIVRQKKGELSVRLSELLDTFVSEMFDAAPDASLQQLSTSFGITFDKLQLMKGDPTERIAHEHKLSDSERAARIDELFNAARTRRDGSATGDAPAAIH